MRSVSRRFASASRRARARGGGGAGGPVGVGGVGLALARGALRVDALGLAPVRLRFEEGADARVELCEAAHRGSLRLDAVQRSVKRGCGPYRQRILSG